MQVKHALCVYIFAALALGQGGENIHTKLLGNDLTAARIEVVKPPGLTPFRKTAFSGIPVGNQLPTSPWGGNFPAKVGMNRCVALEHWLKNRFPRSRGVGSSFIRKPKYAT